MRLASWTMIALTVAACGGGHDVVDSSAITCGPGAILVGDECVAVDAAPAGPPTHYELRAMPQIGADGVGWNRVIALGTRADGSPADDVVVFNTDRAGAGVYTHPQVALGALGATTNFVPCDRALPGCLGPLTLTVALASDPSTPVASVPVELVDPIELDPARPCRAGGNMMIMSGNDQILTGSTTITEGTWTFAPAYADQLVFDVQPPGETDHWHLMFNTTKLCPYMLPHVYDDAVRAFTIQSIQQPPDHPGMDISGFGQQCDTISGWFQVLDYQINGSNGVDLMTIYFEQHCNEDPTTMVSGCVHYQP